MLTVDNLVLGQVYELDSSAASPHLVADCEDSSFPSLALQAARAYMDRWLHVTRYQTYCQLSQYRMWPPQLIFVI